MYINNDVRAERMNSESQLTTKFVLKKECFTFIFH